MTITRHMPRQVIQVVQATRNIGIILLRRRSVLRRHLLVRSLAVREVVLIAIGTTGRRQLTIRRRRAVFGPRLTRASITNFYFGRHTINNIRFGRYAVRVQSFNTPRFQVFGIRT